MRGILYGVFLDDGTTTARFPVNPIGELSIEHPTENEHMNVLNIGEIAIGRSPMLRIVTWESFFPMRTGDTYTINETDFKTPEWWVDWIKSIQAKAPKEPARLIIDRRDITGTLIFSDNFQVLVEEFTTTEKGGEVGDIYYQIKLSEWKPHEAKTVELQLPERTIAAAPVQTAAPQVVQAVVEPQRDKPITQLAVGDKVKVSGKTAYTTKGDEPLIKNANDLTAQIMRWDKEYTDRAKPITVKSADGKTSNASKEQLTAAGGYGGRSSGGGAGRGALGGGRL